MDLIINGKKAVLKRGSSFDYVSENRSFSDADDYTLSITLPLADCPENLEIFGHLDRMDIESRHIVLDASIVDIGFSKNGVITVVEATDVEIKVQFLEGRSVQNFLTNFDDVYINELPLGTYPRTSLPTYPAQAHGGIDHGANAVALPWVNETGDIQNEVIFDENGYMQWGEDTVATGKLSYQPYLIYIAKKICENRGYTYDFSQWENSQMKYLLICNTLPAAWDIPQFARALPHWTVTEFFEELEKILVAEISIDHRAKHISLVFCDNVEWAEHEVKLENILDSFAAEVAYEESMCKFKGIANLRYKARGDKKWSLDQCQWLVDLLRQDGKYFKEFQTWDDYQPWYLANFGVLGTLITDRDAERGDAVGQLIHVVETDTYALWKVVYANLSTFPNMYFYERVDINRFGDVVYDPNSNNDIELAFVPARLDTTDDVHGVCIFMSPSGFNEKEDLDEDEIRQPMAYSALMKGKPDSSAEYYDAIHIAYWDGHSSNHTSVSTGLLPPAPYVDERFSLKNLYQGYLSGIKVSPRERLKVSWISSSIPNVRSVFHIRGRKYLCEKITATFTEDGMSQLLKGEFFALAD